MGKNYREKCGCGASRDGAVLDFGLLGQIFCRLNGGVHPLDGEESGQIGRVGGNHDQGEEPPHAGHHTGGDGPKSGPF
jgi:hypothetical protein